MKIRLQGAAAIVGAAVLALSACSSSTTTTSSNGTQGVKPPKIAEASKLGSGEGKLNLVVWAGYAEDGSDDKSVDWVHPFEQKTGCQVNAKVAGTSDEMVQLMRTGQYDGVSASGDATLRLIYAGNVAPVNTDLVPNYKTISDFLKDKPWNSVDGQMYGVPHGWGANVLAWNKAAVKTAPTSWASVFDASSPYHGKVTAYDSPIYIADAALYLSKTKPELGIKDPYSLTEKQLDAAVALLKQQNANVGEYWSDYTKAVQSFESGSSVIGTSWQVIANLINSDKKVQVGTTVPTEGATGWSDTWMLAAKAAHPNCMYEWMDWITSPKVNAEVAEWFGEAPAQTLSCAQTSDKDFCNTYHATDAAYASQIHYWTTPQKQCVDGSGTTCTDYAEWVTKWQQMKG
ncbi:ABC transporter substrate-binding protein [Nocardioides sp. BP30]|uniref:ABC transporter substrate-binding protein n=1 Tax=Nocardioides sp. BP30 TaxID=3036374 RepID=UPI002468F430|nr:ABC transporter substrate-binding protein [Nocardioides sp. BP30]WGL53741.1 ABC transporter substrate-binding protein [Nocardioides sp. BP30]